MFRNGQEVAGRGMSTHVFFRTGSVFFLLAAVVCGCKTGELENRLDEMERRADRGESHFRKGLYRAADMTFCNLAAEPTVSAPLYRLDSVPCRILSGKKDEAHRMMHELRVDLEELHDPESEKKALSKWHGEVNKVYKGAPHEMGAFYALMALSCAERGEYEDAWRCVQNGLLHDSDAGEDKYRSDDALLLYLGSVFAARIGEVDAAAQCRTRLKAALALRDASAADPEKFPKSAHAPLLDEKAPPPNVFLVFWTGTPPQFGREGKYGEKRTILKGCESAADFMTVSVDGGAEKIVPDKIGDINFQATTQGGRLMDNILADKAAFKQDMKNFQKVSIGLSGLCFVAAAATFDSSQAGLILGGSFLAAGVAFLVVDGIFYQLYDKTDPRADIRTWKTLPGQLNIMPLTLPPGKHEVVVRSYVGGDALGVKKMPVDVPGGEKTVVAHMADMKDTVLDEAIVLFDKTARLGRSKAPEEAVSDYPDSGSDRDVSAWYSVAGSNAGDGRFTLKNTSDSLRLVKELARHGYANRWTARAAMAGTAPSRPDKILVFAQSFRRIEKTDEGANVLATRVTVAVRGAGGRGADGKFRTGPVKFFYAWSHRPATALTIDAVSAAERNAGTEAAIGNLFRMPAFRHAMRPNGAVSVGVKRTEKDGTKK